MQPSCCDWTQQERAGEVNNARSSFFSGCRPADYLTMRVNGMDREAPLPAATKFTV
jgi:hypothetical protein